MTTDIEKADLSVVVITKNESSRIKDCIESVSFANEIIVVDDNSSDNTREIAESLGARVFVREMENEGKHRNYSYSLATSKWVLSLDADERVSPELAAEIIQTVKTDNTHNGFGIPRKNYIGGYWARWGGMYPSRQLKLFRKGVFEYEAEAEVHPRAIMEDPRGELNGDIIHYTYRDFSDCVRKLDGQTSLEARKWIRENRKISLLNTIRKSIDRFCKSYFKKKGYKDGVIGLFLSVNSGMYQFLTYLKVREARKGVAKVPS